tara:strand:+ start:86 stop:325 length:240 start_codon:yes stop_codon:yes gene_type:complete
VLIVYPKEIVYANGCESLNATELVKLTKIKNTKNTKLPVSLVCSSISQAYEYKGQMDNASCRLLKSYLPCPLTFILLVT